MEKAKYTAEQIAQWFINRAALDVDMFYGDYITNMKLQKLLYFAQGLSYAVYNKPLFKEAIQAWDHGPVVPVVYHKYKVCHNDGIQDVNPVILEDPVALLLEYVFEKFGIYSAAQLRNISHNQMPYSKNYVDGIKNILIPNEDIKKEFEKDKEDLIKEFKEKYSELAGYAETCYVNSIPGLKERILNETMQDAVEVDWKDEF